jgi:hypothetical protein
VNAVAPPPFWWVQPAVVATGTILSLLVACAAILTNRKIARAKATLDLIDATETREFYVALYEHFRRVRTDAIFRTTMLDGTSKTAAADLNRCYEYLNHYEVIAIGFKVGILDEKFYRRWMEWVVLRDYKAGAPIIVAARHDHEPDNPGDPKAYCDFEKLCIKWGVRPVSQLMQSDHAPRPWGSGLRP